MGLALTLWCTVNLRMKTLPVSEYMSSKGRAPPPLLSTTSKLQITVSQKNIIAKTCFNLDYSVIFHIPRYLCQLRLSFVRRLGIYCHSVFCEKCWHPSHLKAPSDRLLLSFDCRGCAGLEVLIVTIKLSEQFCCICLSRKIGLMSHTML